MPEPHIPFNPYFYTPHNTNSVIIQYNIKIQSMVMDNTVKQGKDYNLVKIGNRDSETENNIIVNELHGEQKPRYVLLEENIYYASFISLVFFPYILGMLLSLILFYFYMGIPVKDFFHVYSGLSQILFWVFGTYLMITLFDVWWIVKKIFSRA